MQIDELLRNNQLRAWRVAAPHLAAQPVLGVAVVTCMDARIEVVSTLGLQQGDVHLISNAGAAVTDDTLRSLLVSQRVLQTREVMLIAHSGCGMGSLDSSRFIAELGAEPPFDLQTFRDVDEHVRKGVARIRSFELLPARDAVRGFVLELPTGQLREVAAEG